MIDFHIFTYPLNGILMIALPVALGYYLARKFNLPGRIWWIGATTFILSQVGHIPFNAGLTLLFERGILPRPSPEWRLYVNACILGLSAGLWEEMARYTVLKWWAKDVRSWRKGIFYGAGHGGIEAIILGVLVLVNFFYTMAIRNIDLTTLVPPDRLDATIAQLDAYWSAPWYAIMLGAVERTFSILLHLSLAVLVLQSFLRHQIRWLFVAILWHALIDGVAVISVSLTNPYTTEVVLGIFAFLSVLILFTLRQPGFELEEAPGLEEPAPRVPVLNSPQIEIPETPENLDGTRFI
jgi:uncharacterized membrane protein YhfC